MTRNRLNAALLALAFALLIGVVSPVGRTLTVQAARLLAILFALHENGMLIWTP